ncbi:hypothetical protein SAMN05192574_101395 [Mucilaginibacter gossypiicola]|uniref:Uncharacterized protein n=1 Tax=Mucilaginibacter gossypiicola TaxID=551995 RepID=A0A1H8AAK5_9SPHI|nr:hypothetical protein [Mucilaginibacter gossypiicola]SEM66597.1 hypothetical protein SAMN05192574_101395 [Mucilaginibacter gossypiicola]
MAAVNVQTININDAVKGWAEVTIDRFHEALDKYDIGRLDGALWQSLAYELVQANGDIERVIIKFKQYGRYIDMRVGKGRPIGNRRRKKSPWYSKTKTREAGILRLILMRDFGVNWLAEVEGEFNGTEILIP